ncbi:hypothetical protein AHMF7605_21030 [Adhaeribacter arboris]|uniref:Uncharacterized protein n=1 Tax=Adhaeribacter arboris TaxID=2072846 RepID=A0A2T2YJX7_9BACT|nr:hypothetical protein [Adhaeribacter arboris]PSR55802.1 hypothetical protein AHMF7605_21030 [Adhaeribacter arboris]
MMYSKFLTPAIFTAGEADIRSHIRSFMAGYSKCIYLNLVLTGIGLYLQYFQQLTDKLFVFTLGSLGLLFLGQMLLSFSFMLKNLWVALLGSFCSLALATGFTAVLFTFQGWWGARILLTLTAPLGVITFLVLIGYLFTQRNQYHKRQNHFLFFNLLIPFAVLLLLSVMSFWLGGI